MSLVTRLHTWGSLVKFSHSVFALPFAIVMALVVGRRAPPSLSTVACLLVCIVAARTAAMGFNRIVDRAIDAQNPRTAMREIPRGAVSLAEAITLTAFSAGVFMAGAALIGTHCLVMAPLVLALLLGYSLLKRYTSACHFVLGLALACAPGGVWYALTGEWSTKPLPLMIAVMAWVAGFDILYSVQDIEFDRRSGLWSVPARLGSAGAMRVAAGLHIITVLALADFGNEFVLGAPYWIGLALFAALLANQYVMIQRRGTGCIDQVFFTRNGLASVLLCLSVLADVLLRSH